MNNNEATRVRGDARTRRTRLVVSSAVVSLALVAGAFTVQSATADDPTAPVPGTATSPELMAAFELARSYDALWDRQAKGRSVASEADQVFVSSRSLVKLAKRQELKDLVSELKPLSQKWALPAELTNELIAVQANQIPLTESSIAALSADTWNQITDIRRSAVSRAEYVRGRANKATSHQRSNIRKAESKLIAAVKAHSSTTSIRFTQLASAVSSAEKRHNNRHGRTIAKLEPRPTTTPKPFSDADAQAIVEKTWAAVPLPDQTMVFCVYRNYGTWSAGSFPPPPTAVGDGAYVAYTAYAKDNVGYVQYFSCDL